MNTLQNRGVKLQEIALYEMQKNGGYIDLTGLARAMKISSRSAQVHLTSLVRRQLLRKLKVPLHIAIQKYKVPSPIKGRRGGWVPRAIYVPRDTPYAQKKIPELIARVDANFSNLNPQDDQNPYDRTY